GLRNRDELFRLIEPFEKSVSVAAHTHTQRVHEFTKNDGWMGAEPHTHVVHVTPCGSWWSGEPDQRGIPHATMSDGAPNGWLEWSFTEKDWAFQFEASGPQRNESMHATLQPASSGDGGTISVNVWGGTPRTHVEVKEVASNAWRTLKRTKAPDPFFLALREDDQANLSKNGGWRSLPKPSTCEHLWVGNYQDHPTGEVLIRVTDPWGGVEEKTFIAP
ncbi:MAG: calcineurin-like phosphoesterase C-terminal domain-containing protein, partial [Planctomycetes bacterium]|nr:calcineurin-like phosphoesterase C-terminal domain-containing protein [Planctomycetota bacterium]